MANSGLKTHQYKLYKKKMDKYILMASFMFSGILFIFGYILIRVVRPSNFPFNHIDFRPPSCFFFEPRVILSFYLLIEIGWTLILPLLFIVLADVFTEWIRLTNCWLIFIFLKFFTNFWKIMGGKDSTIFCNLNLSVSVSVIHFVGFDTLETIFWVIFEGSVSL